MAKKSGAFTLIEIMVVVVILGILAATRPNSLIDHSCRVIATAGVSLPVFFTGLILIYVFYYHLGWAPPPLGRPGWMGKVPARQFGAPLAEI